MAPVAYKLASKYGHRLPELITRAMAGDPTAIFTITVLGGITLVAALKK